MKREKKGSFITGVREPNHNRFYKHTLYQKDEEKHIHVKRFFFNNHNTIRYGTVLLHLGGVVDVPRTEEELCRCRCGVLDWSVGLREREGGCYSASGAQGRWGGKVMCACLTGARRLVIW